MRELREDTFSGNKNNDAHEHVERVLDIINLFKFPGVTHDAVMLRVFPITLTGAAKRWVDRLSPRTVDYWDLLKKAFIQRYCPPSKTAKQLEDICNFKQEGDKTLYQAFERYNDMLDKCPTHDINSHQKVNIFYNGLGTMNHHHQNDEAAKRHAEQDEWLKKIYQNTETNREAHDKIIHGLETKQETDKSEMEEALVALDITPEIKQVSQEEKKSVSYYVDPYKPPIPFLRRLEHHAEEVLIHENIESLKKIKINYPLLKEIRQTNNYAKHMKNLVANKPRTQEDEEIRMNPRLDFNNALVDLGASISIMPLLMYKHLGIGKLKPINMMIEMADKTKCTPKGIVENLLIKIDKFIFPVDFVILDMVEDFKKPIILGRPFLATTRTK
ncbi:hypothetical protein Tco_0958454, partial [Tanacetum coccineum]